LYNNSRSGGSEGRAVEAKEGGREEEEEEEVSREEEEGEEEVERLSCSWWM